MIDYSSIYEAMSQERLSGWSDTLRPKVDAYLNSSRWGDLPKWFELVKQLPDIRPSQVELDSHYISVGSEGDCDSPTRTQLKNLLQELCPWRKGPFDLFGIKIDTEWRSDLKWDRLKDHITPLKNRLVLDVGCGNGYYCWRMAGQGARLVLGVDPTILYPMQFQVAQRYIQNKSVSVLPVGVDDLPDNDGQFDTVFSMGLLYHRRAPLDHLIQLRSFLREGGELVLETIIIEGKEGEVLAPKDRYARMPNVWFIPTPLTLEGWLKRMGFTNIRLVNVCKTTTEEQRATEWIGSQSLESFLDPDDANLTVEGYPAPKRAVFVANKKGH